jgi:hypothetical protein
MRNLANASTPHTCHPIQDIGSEFFVFGTSSADDLQKKGVLIPVVHNY